MKLKNEHLVFVGLAVALVLMAWGSWTFLFQPLNLKVEAERRTLAEERAKLEDAKAKAAQYEKFLAEAENVRRGLQFLNSRLDARLPYLEQVGLFDSLGRGLGLEAYSISMGKVAGSKEAPGLNQLPVTVKFQSGYHEVGAFLNRATSEQRLLYPVGMHLSSNDASGRLKVLNASVDLLLLYNAK